MGGFEESDRSGLYWEKVGAAWGSGSGGGEFSGWRGVWCYEMTWFFVGLIDRVLCAETTYILGEGFKGRYHS